MVHRASLRSGILVLAIASIPCTGQINHYCNICPDHTLCIYQEIPNNECGSGVITRGISYKQRDMILDLHNYLRSKVARGLESTGPQPKAANMKLMQWDYELQAVAQRWADQCTFGHDSCRTVDRFSVGQNVYIKYSRRRTGPPDWRLAIMEWYKEVNGFDTSNIPAFRFMGTAGHYSQLVSAETQLIGCGHKEWASANRVASIYICNYGPSGNIRTKPLYVTGSPCTACVRGAKCMSGLCVDTNP